MNFNIVKRLSVNVTLKERLISIIGLILLAVLFFALRHQTSPGVYQYELKWLLLILCKLWIVTSILNKVLIICGWKVHFLGKCTLICFALLFISAITLVSNITPYERPAFYEVLVTVGFIGNLFIDATLAFSFLRSEEEVNTQEAQVQ